MKNHFSPTKLWLLKNLHKSGQTQWLRLLLMLFKLHCKLLPLQNVKVFRIDLDQQATFWLNSKFYQMDCYRFFNKGLFKMFFLPLNPKKNFDDS